MATVNDISPPHDLHRAYEEYRRAGAIQDDLFQNLIRRLHTSENSLARESTELEQQKTLVAYYHKQVKEQDLELKAIRRRQEQSGFVLVLIDGDITLFQDEYIQQGQAGGSAAAQELRTAVQQHLDSLDLSCRVMVNIYASISGLKKAHNCEGIYNFIKGFNMFDGLYQMIEAGDGKECADEKVKKLFEIFIDNTHCKHVIFGGSGDNGYARLLRPFVGDDRITLLEGAPIARELAHLDPPFEKITFGKVFRDTKIQLPIRTASIPTLPLPKPVEEPKVTTPAVPPTPSTWASTVSTAVPVPAQTKESSTPTHKPSHPYRDGLPVYRNANDERVDEPLTASPKEIQEIKRRKLCNQYHIFDNCTYAGSQCVHKHDKRLTDREFLAQRSIARRVPCKYGLACNDRWCSSGHQCVFGTSCIQTTCWFPKEMHSVDTQIASVE